MKNNETIDLYSIKELNQKEITANSNLKKEEFKKAEQIIVNLQEQTSKQIKEGYGPFLAAIYDDKENLIAQMPNTVTQEQSCLNHAEMNTIKEAHRVFKSYDLAPYNLSIYITAEPCMMCAGAIMWSGINKVFYGVPSKDVEEITGFDEGYKPDWITAFKDRNIEVFGNIKPNFGKDILKEYSQTQEIYKPSRR